MSDSRPVDASPVKEFFINIITRDVEIMDTIPEFVDNSIDGANRMGGEYEDYYIDINIQNDQLEITDNCGGIPEEIAREYAFRFGRSEDVSREVDSIIGKFGVGMKRSLFSLGRHFIVESKTSVNHFIIEVNVEEWLKNKDDWEFEMELIPDDESDERCELSDVGTRIEVNNLIPEVQKEFEQDLFITRLKNELSSTSGNYVRDGLTITVNNEPVGAFSIDFLNSDDLVPASKTYIYQQGESNVEVNIKAGFGERSPDDAGWYIFCNGRLVIDADKNSKTGWGDRNVPQYHNDYARFRGIINFKSSDPGELPWTTTKTDVNTDSPVYRNAKQEMQQIMRNVIDGLNEISNEKKEKGESTIEQKVESASIIKATEIESEDRQIFKYPEPDTSNNSDEPDEVYIQYTKKKEKVENAKQALGVNTNKKVGSKTFEYFYGYEVGE